MRRLVEAAIRKFAILAIRGPAEWGTLTRYSIAVALIGLATLLRFSFAPQEAGIPYITYFPAATLAAILGGIGPAALATILGAVTAVFLFIPPFGAVRADVGAVVSATVFIIEEAVVCSAIVAMRRYYSGYIAALADLKQAHAAENAARIEADRANAAKSRFLAAASHDLRQPYQALRLFHATLQNPDLPPNRAREVIDNMDVAISAGEELLQSLLDLSTLEAGVVVPKPVDVSAADILGALECRHGPVARSKGLSFRVVSCPWRIKTDPVLLARILDNLIVNAIRYTDKGGVLVACRRSGERRVFEVWDTGVGIAPEHCEGVFQEFYQIDNPERDRAKGVGLGLAVVAKTAHLLGMSVTMDSRPGHGTRFRVVMPS